MAVAGNGGNPTQCGSKTWILTRINEQKTKVEAEQWMRQHQQSKGPMSDILAEMPDVAPEVVKKAVREMLEMPRPSGFVLNQK